MSRACCSRIAYPPTRFLPRPHYKRLGPRLKTLLVVRRGAERDLGAMRPGSITGAAREPIAPLTLFVERVSRSGKAPDPTSRLCTGPARFAWAAVTMFLRPLVLLKTL